MLLDGDSNITSACAAPAATSAEAHRTAVNPMVRAMALIGRSA